MKMSVEWFNWYCSQIDKEKNWATYRDRYLCPCCYMPTLDDRGAFELCSICFWEDDGQDSDDADIIRGGPNHNYSLSEARENFQKYLTMYRPNDKRAFEMENKIKPKKEKLYNAYQEAIQSNSEELWNKTLELEKDY